MAMRGLGLGSIVQKLTVAALSKIPPQQYTQATSVNSIVRFVFTAMGTAVLTSFLQSRLGTHPLGQHAPSGMEQKVLAGALHASFRLSLIPLVVAFAAVCGLGVLPNAAWRRTDSRAKAKGNRGPHA